MAKVDHFSRYEKAGEEPKHRIVAASVGEVGTGKTSWWLGAPGPILVQTLDQGLEGVVEPYSKFKDIYVANYDMGVAPGAEFTHTMAVEARDKFIEDFEHAIRHSLMRTVIWDRESDLWPLFSFAEWGTDDMFAAAPAKDWDKLKGKIRRLIAMAKASDVNFGIIQGMSNEWGKSVNPRTGAKTSTPTGNRVRKGMDDIPALVHVDLLHTREEGQFGLTVCKCRGPGSRAIQDETFKGSEFLEFKDFAQLVFPDSEPSEWE